jgi:hypothetical protein
MAAGFLTPLMVDLQMHLPSLQGLLQIDERAGEAEQRSGKLAASAGEGEHHSPSH